MSDDKQTCEQRVDAELARTEQNLVEQWAGIDKAVERGDWEREESLREEMEPLSLEVKRVLKIMLSWGGPSDWIEADLSHEGYGYEVESLTYHFADWFDHAERVVLEHEAPALWRLAEHYAELASDEWQ